MLTDIDKIRQAFGPRRVRSSTSSLFSLDLVFRRLGPWISIPIVFQYWPGATYTAAQGPIPTQTTPAVDGRTPRDILLKIALFLTSFFIVFSSLLDPKIPPEINQKSKKWI